MAKFKSHHSTYDGDGNKQKGVGILFSDRFWTENENLYKSDNGETIISIISRCSFRFTVAGL